MRRGSPILTQSEYLRISATVSFSRGPLGMSGEYVFQSKGTMLVERRGSP